MFCGWNALFAGITPRLTIILLNSCRVYGNMTHRVRLTTVKLKLTILPKLSFILYSRVIFYTLNQSVFFFLQFVFVQSTKTCYMYNICHSILWHGGEREEAHPSVTLPTVGFSFLRSCYNIAITYWLT
jgi:hypothetical protein